MRVVRAELFLPGDRDSEVLRPALEAIRALMRLGDTRVRVMLRPEYWTFEIEDPDDRPDLRTVLVSRRPTDEPAVRSVVRPPLRLVIERFRIVVPRATREVRAADRTWVADTRSAWMPERVTALPRPVSRRLATAGERPVRTVSRA